MRSAYFSEGLMWRLEMSTSADLREQRHVCKNQGSLEMREAVPEVAGQVRPPSLMLYWPLLGPLSSVLGLHSLPLHIFSPSPSSHCCQSRAWEEKDRGGGAHCWTERGALPFCLLKQLFQLASWVGWPQSEWLFAETVGPQHPGGVHSRIFCRIQGLFPGWMASIWAMWPPPV